jgi:hypothetical protein
MLSLLPVILAGAFALADPAAANPSPSIPTPASLVLTAPERRVRAPEERVRTLLAQGFSRSPTFASLLLALNRSDVIVYIETVMTLPADTAGRLTLVPFAGQTRYLRIQIRPDLSRRDAIALIGHEMRHALEVAERPDVRDFNGMIRLYEEIGHPSGGEHAYDTTAAQETGRKVKSELPG